MIRRLFGKRSQRSLEKRARLMEAFRVKYANFKTLLESNSELLKIIADIEGKLRGQTVFGLSYIEAQTMRSIFHCARMIQCLEHMAGKPIPGLNRALSDIHRQIKAEQGTVPAPKISDYTLDYDIADSGIYQISRESVESVGEKNASICEVANRVGLPVPRGFAITTSAFHRFISHNRLEASISRLKQKLDIIDTETVVQVSGEIQQQVSESKVPEDLAEAIYGAYDRLQQTAASNGEVKVSLRSSALGEDSSLSFAGQYLTRLNVTRERILDEYVAILASLFSSRAISYRLHMGIPFQEAAMAVACQEMIEASASGVMYTRNPLNPLENRIQIHAVWGLGPYAVDGVVPPDVFLLEKTEPVQLVESRISEKTVRLSSAAEGGVLEEPVGREHQKTACLTEDQASTLAEYGMRLESHFEKPQDVEWALDREGRLVILQARPLRVETGEAGARVHPTDPVPGFGILLEGGAVACAGVGSGPAFHIHSEADLLAFPDGGVLVCAHSSPQLVMVMGKARAIVTDAGNIAGHMASLAREYMIPTMLNTVEATVRIPNGAEITVDAFNGRIYRGRVQSLLDSGLKQGGFMTGTPAYRALRRRADLIVPLNLLDPRSSHFSPENCRTIHDIMRYIHEKSYQEIFQLGDHVTDRGNLSVRLKGPIPIDLYVIDLGGGLAVDATTVSSISPDQVLSVPFKAMLHGMLHEGFRPLEPRPVNFGGFFSVMSRQILTPPNISVERFGDRSYAIISDRYLNFSSRVGYHYSILDCYCGKTLAKNYINFEFKGGAADDLRRNRRARVIECVLTAMGFFVRTNADRVTARYAKAEASEIEKTLDQLGRLLIYTRQMDMLMHSEDLVKEMADHFMNGNYCLMPVSGQEPDIHSSESGGST